MQTETQDADDDQNGDVNRLLKFRTCTDAWELETGDIRATFSHDIITTGMVGSRPQSVMLDRGYAVAAVSDGDGETTITYRKLTEFRTA